MTDSISAPNDDPLNSMVPFARVNSNDSMDSSSKVRAKRPSSSNSAQAPSPSMAKSKEKKSATDDLGIMSFRKAKYESVEMQRLLSLGIPDVNISTTLDDLTYKPSLVFPDWVLHNQNWKLASLTNTTSTSISDILKTHFSKRTPEQLSTAVHWLMSVWKIADTMGFKRCNAMLKEFKLESFPPGVNIITEGERGLTFYIIIEGKTAVHKEGIGIVGYLGKGKSFGEIALTQGKDLRTATITTETAVDVVSLHKTNYEYFVRDIQDQEKRENFKILSECKLFSTWPKGKIEKMLNSCVRKLFDAGQYIFHQGDPPNDLCIMVEGSVEIVKELVIVCKNRWPVAINRWKELKKRIHKPILLKTLHASDFFGEMAILKDMPRSTSAIAVTRTVILSLDRLEFLHLISYGSSTINGNAIQEEETRFNEIINKYINDQDILDAVSYFKGGPDSEAVVGTTKVLKNELQGTKEADELLVGKDARVKSPVHHLNRQRSMSPGRKELRSRDETYKYADEINKITKGQELVQQLQKTAKDTVRNEHLKKDRAGALVGHSYSAKPGELAKQASRFSMARGDSQNISFVKRGLSAGPSQSKRDSHHRHHQLSGGPSQSSAGSSSQSTLGTLNDRRIRGRSAGFHRGSIYSVDNRRRSTIRFAKRGSLAGIDNDPRMLYGVDAKVLLRRNTAINLGPVYQEVYRQLQNEMSNEQVAETIKPFMGDRRQSTHMMDALSRQMIDRQLTHRGSICGQRTMRNLHDDAHHEQLPAIANNFSPDRQSRSKLLESHSASFDYHGVASYPSDAGEHHALHFGAAAAAAIATTAGQRQDQQRQHQPIHGVHGVAPVPHGLNATALTVSPYQGRKTYMSRSNNQMKGFNTGGTTKLKTYYAYEDDQDNDDASHQSMGSQSSNGANQGTGMESRNPIAAGGTMGNHSNSALLHDIKKGHSTSKGSDSRKDFKYLKKAKISYRDAMEG